MTRKTILTAALALFAAGCLSACSAGIGPETQPSAGTAQAAFPGGSSAADPSAEKTEPDETTAAAADEEKDPGKTVADRHFQISGFRFAQSLSGLYEKIAAAGLSEEARRANGQNYLLEDRYLPIFRLNDTEELRQFGERYDDGTGGIYYTDLKHLTESFDEADLEGKTVYAIFCTMYNGTYREDEFSVEAMLRDGVLRFIVNVRAEDGRAMVDMETAYWLLIMMDSSAASSAEAFEAVFVH